MRALQAMIGSPSKRRLFGFSYNTIFDSFIGSLLLLVNHKYKESKLRAVGSCGLIGFLMAIFYGTTRRWT